MNRPIITLLTDFGDADAYAGIMKGVVLGLCPEAQIVDLTHQIPPQKVRAAALVLRAAAPFFPRGTIHVAVVDPGVGSRRAAALVQTATAWFIGPDNGVLHPAASAAGIQRVIELAEPRYWLPEMSRTFHGRDIFAPAAGHLAAGVEAGAFGPELGALRQLDFPAARREAEGVSGEVAYIDRFGNAITNIAESDLPRFPRSELSVSIAGCVALPVVGTYEEIPPGKAAALIGSWGSLEVAVRQGDAAAILGVSVGSPVSVSKR